MHRAIILLSLFGACTRPPSLEGKAGAPPDTTYRLGIAPGVVHDSTDAHIAATLQGFLRTKDGDTRSPYWKPEDFEAYVHPYADLLHIEAGWNGPRTYRPTLAAIAPTERADQRVAKLAFLGADSSGILQLRALFDVLVTVTPERVTLERMLARNTRTWTERTVGTLVYRFPPGIAFDAAAAQEEEAFNQRVAAFFGSDTLPFTYYVCVDPEQVFRIRGFEHWPLMYAARTGGQNETWSNTVYAGNGAFRYDHELVHSYAVRAAGGGMHLLLEEGICTLLGGSNEKPFAHHRAALAAFMAAHPDERFAMHLDPAVHLDLDGGTSVAYAVGGLLCERALRLGGRERLFDLFRSSNDEDGLWKAMALIGLSPTSIDAELRAELQRPFTLRVP
ncbi:MAG: hypothetical protein QM724_02950 [Flavobacteriales bacterium]